MRVKGGPQTRRRHKRILKKAKGFTGVNSRLIRSARTVVERAGVFAYRDRRQRKRQFRRLWITRINAGARMNGMSYSRLISGLTKKGVAIDRKMLAELAVKDMASFARLCEMAQA